MTGPCAPTWPRTVASHRTGRAVTMTNGIARRVNASRTASVRAETLLSPRNSVPSRSDATRQGRSVVGSGIEHLVEVDRYAVRVVGEGHLVGDRHDFGVGAGDRDAVAGP